MKEGVEQSGKQHHIEDRAKNKKEEEPTIEAVCICPPPGGHGLLHGLVCEAEIMQEKAAEDRQLALEDSSVAAESER